MAQKKETWTSVDGGEFTHELPALIQDLLVARENSPNDRYNPGNLTPEMVKALQGISGFVRRIPPNVRGT